MAKNETSPPVEWRPVVGYEDYYEVSSDGRVRQCADSKHKRRHRRCLRPGSDSGGYPIVALFVNGSARSFRIHKLMQGAFFTEIEDVIVDHINGIKDDNRLTNLQQITQRENVVKGERSLLGNWSSPLVGASWKKAISKWASAKMYKGRRCTLGYFSTETEASEAYHAATDEYLEYRHSLPKWTRCLNPFQWSKSER